MERQCRVGTVLRNSEWEEVSPGALGAPSFPSYHRYIFFPDFHFIASVNTRAWYLFNRDFQAVKQRVPQGLTG